MNWAGDKLAILQNLEFAIADFWRNHPEFADYGAGLAYEAAYDRYRAEARGHVPKPPTLTGLDLQAFEALRQMCEFRLGRGSFPGSEAPLIPAISVDQLVECLRELRKSVERHTALGGRQGYLKFVEPYVR